MRKRSFTYEEQKRQEKTAERLKALIDGKYGIDKTSRKALAEKIGVVESTIRNSLHKRVLLSNPVAKNLEGLTGIPAAYWKGEVDVLTKEDYEKHLVTVSRASDREKELSRELERLAEEREAFFSLLGYRYITHYPAALDFVGIVKDEDPQKALSTLNNFMPDRDIRHELIRYDDPNDTIMLTSEQLRALMTELQDHLSYQIFKLKNHKSQ